jgi:putative sigma-54 modulation protein
MSIEQAALHLDDSKNEFIVFRDIDTDQVSVIYKRRDNNLGLISPEF